MCNCKGWDIAFWPDDEITVEQHFCRELDDCGHVDNTLEEAADQVADEYKRIFEWYVKNPGDYFTQAKMLHIQSQERQWRERTHPSYLYYATNEVDIQGDGDIV